MIWAKEVCPTTGTPHTKGFVIPEGYHRLAGMRGVRDESLPIFF